APPAGMPPHHPKQREIPAASSLPPTQSEHRIGSMECSLPQYEMLANVRFGSKPDMCAAKRRVCFTRNSDRESEIPQKAMSASPKSGHVQCTRACLLWAKSGHVRCN